MDLHQRKISLVLKKVSFTAKNGCPFPEGRNLKNLFPDPKLLSYGFATVHRRLILVECYRHTLK